MSIIVDSNLTADGSTTTGTITNPNNGATPFQVVYASGTFGGGTLTVEISNDGGSSYFTATDVAGDITFLASGAAVLHLLGGEITTTGKQVRVRCTLAGATSPDINITIADCK